MQRNFFFIKHAMKNHCSVYKPAKKPSISIYININLQPTNALLRVSKNLPHLDLGFKDFLKNLRLCQLFQKPNRPAAQKVYLPQRRRKV